MKQYTINCKTKRMFNYIQDIIENENAYGNLLEGDICYLRVFYSPNGIGHSYDSDAEVLKLAVTTKFIAKHEADFLGLTTGRFGIRASDL